MAYAVKADIVSLYSDAALYVADRDGDGVPDDVAIDQALQNASGEIDVYLGVRYDVPVAPVPQVLVGLSVDIALYRLAQAADVRTTEHRVRYEDALELLGKFATGKAALPPAPVDPTAPVDPDAPAPLDGPRPIVASGPPRLFSRAQMRDL